MRARLNRLTASEPAITTSRIGSGGGPPWGSRSRLPRSSVGSTLGNTPGCSSCEVGIKRRKPRRRRPPDETPRQTGGGAYPDVDARSQQPDLALSRELQSTNINARRILGETQQHVP